MTSGREVNRLYRRTAEGRGFRLIDRGELVTGERCAYGDRALVLRFRDERGYIYEGVIDPEWLRDYLRWYDGLT